MAAIRRHDTGSTGIRRLALWGGLAALLLCPMVAMRFTGEVRWDLADFAIGAALLASVGVVIELAMLASRRPRTRAIVIGGVVLVVLLIWADGAVEIV